LLLLRKFLAAARTLPTQWLSILSSSTRPGSRKDSHASSPQVAGCQEDFSDYRHEGAAYFWLDSCGGSSYDDESVGHFTNEAFILNYLEGGGTGVAGTLEVFRFVGFCVA